MALSGPARHVRQGPRRGLQLRELGVRISMDDFGTGYSSLSYLRSFPFDKIKIDRSFVHDLEANVDSQAIVRAIVSLGASLGITITAEGVETESDLAALQAEGCNEGQGFHFGRPITSEQWDALVDVNGRFGIKITGQTNLCAAASLPSPSSITAS